MIMVDKMRPCAQNENWPYDESCHLFADNVCGLHDFADQIGLKRGWFQQHSVFPHYDLTANMRKKAVKAGAVEVSNKELVEHIRKRRKSL